MTADAMTAMSDQLAADPASLVFLPLAEALLARGELAHAARVARRGAERHAHRPDVHDLVARVALAMGDEVLAERSWKEALALVPDFGPAHRGLGFLAYRQGRWHEAEDHLLRARQLTPGDPALESAWSALTAARASSASLDPATLFDEVLGDTPQVALLLDADGLVVAGRYETADGSDLGAMIGAHLSGVSEEAGRAMRHFGLGAWTRLLLESEAATLMMAPTGEGVTLVAAPCGVPLGFVRRTLDQSAAAATQWTTEPR